LKKYITAILLFILFIFSFSCSMPGGGGGGGDTPPEDPPEIPPDDPPLTITNVYPPEGAVDVETDVLLQWECSITENVTFELYTVTEIAPGVHSHIKIASGITEYSYNFNDLEFLTEYSLRVKAIDGEGNQAWGPIWNFTTKARDNMDDLVLGNNSITDGALHQDTRLRFTWTCGGLKESDQVFYQLYLGTSSDPPVVATDISELSHIVDNLSCNTTYYWAVSVNTESGLSKKSPVWSFSTRSSQPGGTEALLIVVDGSVYADIEDSLLQYKNDLAADNYFPIFLTWYDRPVGELKQIIQYCYAHYSIAGAFLLGDIPIALFFVDDMIIGLPGNTYYEDRTFPSDIFLMDVDENFTDTDGNGCYDRYDFTPLELFVSRIKGDPGQLNHYFSKIHSYKTGGSLVDRSAYVFTDNDWWEINGTRSDNLELIYSSIEFCYDPYESTRSAYVNKLTGDGAEFVIQEVHANPVELHFNSPPPSRITIDDITQYNFKASFYILHNCSAARFTWPHGNLAMTYLMRTDYGLATFGATEVTGGSSVADLIEQLSQDANWGEAFVHWFNNESETSNFTEHSSKLLEKIIYGDPTLRVSPVF
jgi:hypothetical protein